MVRKLVAHSVYSWLPVTQNWIYTQLRRNRSFDHAVISMTAEGEEQFPVDARHTAFGKSAADRIGLFMARYWIRQPSSFYRRLIPKLAPAIIHGHFSTESWRILPYARHAGIPLVTTFYGLDVDKLPRRRYWKKRYKELFAYGSRFMVEGPYMGGRLEAAGCPADKIRIVALGIDRTMYRSTSRPAVPGTDDPVRVLFAGLSREKKGPFDAAAVFIAAAREEPRLELHLVGDGRYRRQVQRMLHRAGMPHRAVFHGMIPFDRYRALLSECDILLAPSRHADDGDCEGGAPVVCIEAQAAGIPVVGTRHCDIPFVVEHGKTGLLAGEGDRTALCGHLLELARNRELRLALGGQGKKHIALQHDGAAQVGKIAAIYNEVLNAADGKAGI